MLEQRRSSCRGAVAEEQKPAQQVSPSEQAMPIPMPDQTTLTPLIQGALHLVVSAVQLARIERPRPCTNAGFWVYYTTTREQGIFSKIE